MDASFGLVHLSCVYWISMSYNLTTVLYRCEYTFEMEVSETSSFVHCIVYYGKISIPLATSHQTQSWTSSYSNLLQDKVVQSRKIVFSGY